MTADETAPENQVQLQKAYWEYAQHELETDFDSIVRNMSRIFDLLRTVAAIREHKTRDEILRAAVVLNHAYLEDFLRTILSALLPISNVDTLDKVPLAGISGRAERFSLGKLVQHRGKSVDDLLRESVSEHLERSTFNNMTEIMAVLESVGVRLPKKEKIEQLLAKMNLPDGLFPTLEAMMQRRHRIVHRADLAKTGDPNHTKTADGLQKIHAALVQDWMKSTISFMLIVAIAAFEKQHPIEKFVKELGEISANFDAKTTVEAQLTGK